MFETEVNAARASAAELPRAALEKFAELDGTLAQRTVLPWAEHCTECAMPACFETCEFYSPRSDLKCRRFVEGVVRVDRPGGTSPYLSKITFKQWGKLEAPGNVRLLALAEAADKERRDVRIAQLLQGVPAPYHLRLKAIRRRSRQKQRAGACLARTAEMPSYFVIECYNPSAESVPLSLTMRPEGPDGRFPYQHLACLQSGYNRVQIDAAEIALTVDFDKSFLVQLVPEVKDEPITLYFGLVDFVSDPSYSPLARKPAKIEGAKKVKCVVWDLDNTLWKGTLVEDGVEKLVLNEAAKNAIVELDKRGILHSIASKNNEPDAFAALDRFGLREYFLYPQVSWNRKSEAIKAIGRSFNIGLDTLLFVDDSDFERAEVAAVYPEVRCLDTVDTASFLARPEFDVPVTPESATRRSLYVQEVTRSEAQQTFEGDYFAFLRDCDIRLSLKPLSEASLQRVHELTQRTNQMNFSANPYDREMLTQILDDDAMETFVLDCSDRFGNYGTIGFCVVDRAEPRMTDLMFSCRVQSKRVEHAFIAFLLRRYKERGFGGFRATYIRTDRNAPSAQVFDDLGFTCEQTEGAVLSRYFDYQQPIPEDGVIRVVAAP